MLSIIIPTHNRAASLRRCLASLRAAAGEVECEVVVVDNNSTDQTQAVVAEFTGLARGVREERTAFSRARATGAASARGDILLYLDDDTLLHAGSLRHLIEEFTAHPECGVVAGRIVPRFEQHPPPWVLACQRAFNGWSLFQAGTIPEITRDAQSVSWAAGPMMAIRRSTYDAAGGFPPDTVGVETNLGGNTFRKLYIGPGDYGLCIRAREAGYTIRYRTDIAVDHVIPPERMTPAFWRSRVIGEGYHAAISAREFFHSGAWRLVTKRVTGTLRLWRWRRRWRRGLAVADPAAGPMLPAELWMLYHRAYLAMDAELRQHPQLAPMLWRIGSEGVGDADYAGVIAALPDGFQRLVADAVMFDPEPANSTEAGRQYERRYRELTRQAGR